MGSKMVGPPTGIRDAIGYIRVSTVEQAESGLGLEAQERSILAYCTLRGLNLVCIESDEGVSASIPLVERPRGAEVVNATMKRHNHGAEFSEVVALKLDRLFRSAEDALATVRQWDEADTTLHLVDQGGSTLDTGSATGRFVLTMLAGVAEMERNLSRERTAAALGAKRARGEKTGGHVPFGYDVVPVDGAESIRLVPNAGEQATIARMRREWDDGISYRGIAGGLNMDGVPSKLGGRWHAETVRGILHRKEEAKSC